MFFRLVSLSLLFSLQWPVIAVPLAMRNYGSLARDGLRAYDVPIQKRRMSDVMGKISRRGGLSGSVGLGDNDDLLYSVPLQLGNTTMAVHLDTGSSDLWVISDACQSTLCANSNLSRYSSPSFNASGPPVTLQYGDSKTGTYASGSIGSDTVTIAGIAMLNQQFASINATTNPVIQYGASGIIGFGFPSGSLIQAAVVNQNFNDPGTTDDFFTATSDDGPLLARMAMSGQLAQPLFAISLQRDTLEIGGTGSLSIGKLPDGVSESNMTWVPVRLYTQAQGGLKAPNFAPNEVYPFRWEIEVDGVYIDGNLMPQSTIPGNGINSTGVSALIDTGNSLIRGPNDVVQNILRSVSPGYNPPSVPTLPCATPHTLAFKIGGQMFPVDPANLITPYAAGNSQLCVASEIVATDPPGVGALFSWSLGDPFLKSTLVAFYYGNITHPSVDPPRIGFLSTVPGNANANLQQAVQSAAADGGTFASTIQYAPTSSAENTATVTITPNAAVSPTSSSPALSSPAANPQPSDSSAHGQKNSAGSLSRHDAWLVLLCPFVLLSVYLL